MNVRKLHISLASTLGLLAVAGLLTLMGAAGGGLPVAQAQGSKIAWYGEIVDAGSDAGSGKGVISMS